MADNESTRRDVAVIYRSYHEAIQQLPEADRLPVYEAIFEYALDGTETKLEGTPAAIFMLIKPTLDTSRRKAANGKKGGKQNVSKPEANDKQDKSNIEAIKDKRQGIKDKEQGIKDKGESNDPPSAGAAPCPFEKIKNLYHSICVSYPTIKTVDGERRKAVAARWKTYKSLDIFAELFRIAEATPFLKGENDRNWSADFDWMMKATNFSKILEHRYDDKAAKSAPSTTADDEPQLCELLAADRVQEGG